MQSLNQALDAMERACETDTDLIGFTEPNLKEITEMVKGLPAAEREEVRSRLERISTIIEGKMMLYGEELEQLKGQIKNVANNNAAAGAYRAAAVFHIQPKSDEK